MQTITYSAKTVGLSNRENNTLTKHFYLDLLNIFVSFYRLYFKSYATAPLFPKRLFCCISSCKILVRAAVLTADHFDCLNYHPNRLFSSWSNFGMGLMLQHQ